MRTIHQVLFLLAFNPATIRPLIQWSRFDF